MEAIPTVGANLRKRKTNESSHPKDTPNKKQRTDQTPITMNGDAFNLSPEEPASSILDEGIEPGSPE